MVLGKCVSGVTNAFGLLLLRRGKDKDFKYFLQKNAFFSYRCNLTPYCQLFLFQMKNDGLHNCLDTMGRKSGEEVGLSYCHGLGGNQVNFINNLDSLRIFSSHPDYSLFKARVHIFTRFYAFVSITFCQ